MLVPRGRRNATYHRFDPKHQQKSRVATSGCQKSKDGRRRQNILIYFWMSYLNAVRAQLCFSFVMIAQHKRTSALRDALRHAPQSMKQRVSGKECVLLTASQQPQPAAQGAHGEPQEEEENHDGAARLSLVRRRRGTCSFTRFKPQRVVCIHPVQTTKGRTHASTQNQYEQAPSLSRLPFIAFTTAAAYTASLKYAPRV